MDLALGYPDTWTFAVDGLIGSSPETLVRVNHGTVTARVLAGSAARGRGRGCRPRAPRSLSPPRTKDLDEHRYAVQSVLDALRPHARGVAASELPFTLKLPNLWHLATDIEGTLSDGSTALDLVAALHPTAAVAGTPDGRGAASSSASSSRSTAAATADRSAGSTATATASGRSPCAPPRSRPTARSRPSRARHRRRLRPRAGARRDHAQVPPDRGGVRLAPARRSAAAYGRWPAIAAATPIGATRRRTPPMVHPHRRADPRFCHSRFRLRSKNLSLPARVALRQACRGR